MRFISRFVMALALLLAGSGARAEKPKPSHEQPMKVTVVRSGEQACEPLCPEWIMAEGQITAATPALFGKLFQELGGRKLPVVIHSPGGSIVAAIQIGYLIRARKLDVAVGRTNYQGCAPFGKDCEDGTSHRGTIVSHRAFCLSACPLILAAGSARLAGLDAIVGVHQWTFGAAPGTPTRGKKVSKSKWDAGWDGVVRRMITDFLGKMGNSQALVDDMKKAPHTSIRLLNMKRRKSLDLITRPDGAQAIASRAVCAVFPPAPHCMVGAGSRSYADALALAGIKPGDQPMTVAVVRNSGPGCEPLCPQWIAAEGVITPATPKLFAKVLKGIGKAKLPVVIDSPGGDLDAALDIARMVRKQGLDVAVAVTGYAGCKPSDTACKRPSAKAPYKGFPIYSGQRCNGVCTLVLAAGRWRYANGNGVVVIHNPETYLSRSSAKPSVNLMQAFLAETGSTARILIEMARLPLGAPSPLPEDELMRIGVVTSPASAAAVLRPDLCKADAPPSFCVRRK